MPDNYISQIDFGDGVLRKLKAEGGGGGSLEISDEEWREICDILHITHTYGVEWDGSSSTLWTRTDASAGFGNPSPAVNNGTGSSPFDNLLPWSGMQVVEDEEAGSLVSIPKYWYKWTRTGSAMKLQIADGPVDGFLVSPAHADRGDGMGERDVVYVGRYHCGSSCKSVAGELPLGNKTRAQFRTDIHNLGSDIWQYDYAMYWTIMMLYLVEYANWDSQAAIGYGCSTSGSFMNMGYTDSMQYHTGTTVANRTTYGGTQYRYIEGLWDNAYDFCDGIYFNNDDIYCIKNPANFSDTSGGTLIGTRTSSYGWITAWNNPTTSGFEYALFPSAYDGSDTTYVSDYYFYNTNGVALFVGGYSYQTLTRGAFYLDTTKQAAEYSVSNSSRVMKLPASA